MFYLCIRVTYHLLFYLISSQPHCSIAACLGQDSRTSAHLILLFHLSMLAILAVALSWVLHCQQWSCWDCYPSLLSSPAGSSQWQPGERSPGARTAEQIIQQLQFPLLQKNWLYCSVNMRWIWPRNYLAVFCCCDELDISCQGFIYSWLESQTQSCLSATALFTKKVNFNHKEIEKKNTTVEKSKNIK